MLMEKQRRLTKPLPEEGDRQNLPGRNGSSDVDGEDDQDGAGQCGLLLKVSLAKFGLLEPIGALALSYC